MIIKISNSWFEEKKYIVDVLFQEFLGLDFTIELKDDETTNEICLADGKKLVLANTFFKKANSDYLKAENIPKTITILEPGVLNPENIPVIFGSNTLSIAPDKITCGIDVLASAFFMLTRWEEYVILKKDQHNRFPFDSSLAFKENFLHIPVVNLYVELIWKCLERLGITQKRKSRTFKIMSTHDVDDIRFWKNPFQFLKIISGDLIFRNNLKLFKDHARSYFRSQFKMMNDPCNTFDYIMDAVEKHNNKAWFFFLNWGESNYDHRYHFYKRLRRIIEKIKLRGHFIGIHPSYNSYNNESLFSKEVDSLEKFSGQKIYSGRQHYLRFEVPQTWSIWGKSGMKWDSSMAYADRNGFRCGACFEFPVFDILQRKQLNVYEYPLICMDVTLRKQCKGNSEEMLAEGLKIKNEARKYNGNFVLLWHNSNLNTSEWKDYKSIFESLISESK